MRKIHILLIAGTLVTVGLLSGCQSEGTIDFVATLTVYQDNLEEILNNLNVYIWTFDNEYDWSILMNYATFTDTMVTEMRDAQTDIELELLYAESLVISYTKDMQGATLSEMNADETSQMNAIDDMVDDFVLYEGDVDTCLDNIDVYIEYVTLTRNKLVYLEEYENKLTLLNTLVESEDYETAVTPAMDIIQLFRDMKDNEFEREELGIGNYSDELLSIWDLYIDGWKAYTEHLNLSIDGKWSQADDKYEEYDDLTNQALIIDSTETTTEANEAVDAWYESHIGMYSDLFEEYYNP